MSPSSPWENVYWFARMLINGDKYGGVGADGKSLLAMAGAVREALSNSKSKPEAVQVNLAKEMVRSVLIERWKNAPARQPRVKLLCDDLESQLQTVEDIQVLLFTCESVILPVNNAMPSIPDDDLQYTEAQCRAYLSTLSEFEGLSTVINRWDDLGMRGCLQEERVVVTREFRGLKQALAETANADPDLVLTAFVQEFERRLSQKRKPRGGRSLEDVTSFLFNYYAIRATNAPEHFQADMEVDKWIQTKDKWLIGISCKRTLRERWKQVSSASSDLLSKFKIKQFWHVITFDEDLSDEKITLLGGQRHIFYLRDRSRIYERSRELIGLKDYVRPMSQFIRDIKSEQVTDTKLNRKRD